MPISISPLSSKGIQALGPLYGCTFTEMGVVLLPTAARPEARAWAPVPAGLVPMATVRGRSLLLLAVGPQSILASAAPSHCQYGRNKKLRTRTIRKARLTSFIVIPPLFKPLATRHFDRPAIHDKNPFRCRWYSDAANAGARDGLSHAPVSIARLL